MEREHGLPRIFSDSYTIMTKIAVGCLIPETITRMFDPVRKPLLALRASDEQVRAELEKKPSMFR